MITTASLWELYATYVVERRNHVYGKNIGVQVEPIYCFQEYVSGWRGACKKRKAHTTFITYALVA
jgi:hypothetical protein